MSILAAIGKKIAGQFVGEVVDGVFGVIERYQNKQITKIEAEAEVRKIVTDAWSKVEVAWADATASMYGSLMKAAQQSKIVAWGWGVTLFSQVGVLVWHQVGIPAYTHWFLEPNQSYPSSGTTVEWAYLLVALLLGGGALMLKGKPPKELL